MVVAIVVVVAAVVSFVLGREYGVRVTWTDPEGVRLDDLLRAYHPSVRRAWEDYEARADACGFDLDEAHRVALFLNWASPRRLADEMRGP